MRCRPALSPPTSPRGFSLLELILVLLIMAGLMALAAPSLRGFTAAREVKDLAASLVTLAKWARLHAAAEGRPYRLNVDLDRHEHWLTTQEGATFEELGVAMGARATFPEYVTVEWEDSEDAERKEYIQFDPSGRTDVATLRLTGKLGTVLDVTCEAPREPFRVVHRPEEELDYE